MFVSSLLRFWNTEISVTFPSHNYVGVCLLLESVRNAIRKRLFRSLKYCSFNDQINYRMYRVSKKKLMPLIFKLAANLLLEFVCAHEYSQHEVVNDCKSTVPFKFPQLKCLLTPNGSLIWYASLTDEIFGQLLSNYSRYAANLNIKAVSFFYSHCIQGESKKLMHFTFKLTANLLLEFVCSHFDDCKRTVPFKFLQLKCILTPTWD